MLYGDEKRREMARSILPSKRRKRARWDQTRVKRRARSKMRQIVREARHDPEGVHERHDLRWEPKGDIRQCVQSRRYADKVEPLIRWATAVTADMPEPDRRSYLKSVLPDGVIGEHALFHLEGFAFDSDRQAWRVAWEARRRRQQALERHRRDRREGLLGGALGDPALLALFNHHLATRHAICTWVTGERLERWFDEEGAVQRTEMRRRTQRVGPHGAPQLGDPDDLGPFLKRVEAARCAPKTVTAALRVGRVRVDRRPEGITEDRRARVERAERPNPEHHPEWSAAVQAFIDALEATGGDPGAVRRHLMRQG
ncbi:MAG: hypothetical protein H6739_22915 [Alphaproteobacteria bacterium]|nr:hypothetical protein [Alphaproteobacteria bacterium]